MNLLKSLRAAATLIIVPAFSVSALAYGHDHGAQPTPTPQANAAQGTPRGTQCPMMQGMKMDGMQGMKMNGMQGMKMDGKSMPAPSGDKQPPASGMADMHCTQTASPGSAPAPQAAPEGGHDHNHAGAASPQ